MQEKGKPGLFPELATAAARWRPRSTTGVAWRGKGGSSAVGVGPGVAGVPLVAVGSRRWPPAEEAERERGGRHRLDLFAISEKFRGRTVKQK